MASSNIPNIIELLQIRLDAGTITMRQAREELHTAGWYNYVPDEWQVRQLLNDYKEFYLRK